MKTYILKYSTADGWDSYFETNEDCTEERSLPQELNSAKGAGDWIGFWSEDEGTEYSEYTINVLTPYEYEQEVFINSI